MSGKQNYKNNTINRFYAQNIFCFNVFCEFEFFSGAENVAFGNLAVPVATGSVNRTLQNYQKQNFRRQKKIEIANVFAIFNLPTYY